MRRCAAWAVAVLPLLPGCDYWFSLSVTSGDFTPAPASAVIASDPAPGQILTGTPPTTFSLRFSHDSLSPAGSLAL